MKPRYPKRGWHKNKTIMKEKENSKRISMLRYSMQRYHRMGNGIMCQRLNREIQKLCAAEASAC